MDGRIRHFFTVPIAVLGGMTTTNESKIKIDEKIHLVSLTKNNNDKDNIIFLIPGGPTWTRNGAIIHGGMILGYLNIDIYSMGHPDCIDLCSLDITKQIRKCIRHLRKIHPRKKIHVIGTSMGGHALSWYLASGFDDGDEYYIWCSNFSTRDFFRGIRETKWLNNYMNSRIKGLKHLDCKLWNPRVIVPILHKKDILSKLKNINCSDRITVVYGDKDKVSRNVEKYASYLGMNVVRVKDGYHCCTNTIEGIAFAVKRNLKQKCRCCK